LDNKYVSTVPFELSSDHLQVMAMSEKQGFIDINTAAQHGWTEERFNLAIVNSARNL